MSCADGCYLIVTAYELDDDDNPVLVAYCKYCGEVKRSTPFVADEYTWDVGPT